MINFRDRRWVLGLVLAVHIFFLIQNARWASGLYARTFSMTLVQRRLASIGGLYLAAQRLNLQVPPNANIWFVSPETPTDIGYFIFPRRLRWGSPSVKDREAIRQAHPNDWTLTNRSSNPADDDIELFPPWSMSAS